MKKPLLLIMKDAKVYSREKNSAATFYRSPVAPFTEALIGAT
jgi:hypothetical protein